MDGLHHHRREFSTPAESLESLGFANPAAESFLLASVGRWLEDRRWDEEVVGGQRCLSWQSA